MDPDAARERVQRRRSTMLKLMLGVQVGEDGAPLFEPEWGQGKHHQDLMNAPRALNRLPFLGPIFAVGWPLDDPGGPRNQLKKSQKAGWSA